MKKSKFFMGISFFLILSLGAILLKSVCFKVSPISNETTTDELQKYNPHISYIEDASGWDEEIYRTFYEKEKKGARECATIIVGKPTGQIYFNHGTILQEVIVKRVIKGACKEEFIWMQNGLLSTIRYDGKNVWIDGMDRSLMQKGSEYLIFCSASRINKYSEKKVYTEADGMWFGCYNITRSSDVIIDKNDGVCNSQAEFYTSSKKALDCFNQTKQKLIKEYL